MKKARLGEIIGGKRAVQRVVAVGGHQDLGGHGGDHRRMIKITVGMPELNDIPGPGLRLGDNMGERADGAIRNQKIIQILDACPGRAAVGDRAVIPAGDRDLPPRMDGLTEYRMSWVRMPARIEGMPRAVFRSPVTTPVSAPAKMAIMTLNQAGSPAVIKTAHTQATVQMAPSTVRSAMSRVLWEPTHFHFFRA